MAVKPAIGGACCVAVILYLSLNSATAASYTFTTIADTDTTYSQFPDANSAINDNGTVVYKATTTAGVTNIYTSTSATPVISNQLFLSEPAINNNGTVAVSSTSGGTTGIYNSTSGTFMIDDSGVFETFADVAINDSATAGFIAQLDFVTGNPVELAISSTPPLNTYFDTSLSSLILVTLTN